jgi:hypothetical protein
VKIILSKKREEVSVAPNNIVSLISRIEDDRWVTDISVYEKNTL